MCRRPSEEASGCCDPDGEERTRMLVLASISCPGARHSGIATFELQNPAVKYCVLAEEGGLACRKPRVPRYPAEQRANNVSRPSLVPFTGVVHDPRITASLSPLTQPNTFPWDTLSPLELRPSGRRLEIGRELGQVASCVKLITSDQTE